MPGIGSIDEGESQCMKASGKHVVTRRRNIARVFMCKNAGCETRCLKRYTLCERVAVVSPECFSALPPFRGILSHPFAWRIRHANSCAKCRRCEDARIQVRLADVVAELTLDARRVSAVAESLRCARGILGPRMDREEKNRKAQDRELRF